MRRATRSWNRSIPSDRDTHLGGTLLNIITVFIGSSIGMAVGNRLPERLQQSIMMGLGLITLVVGLDNAALTGNIIIPLVSLSIGIIIGEWLQIEAALARFGGWLQARVAGDDDAGTTPTDPDALSPRERFITGFVTASLVFCVGPLTFVGSIQDGMGLASGFQFLAIKSVLDFFAGMAFAATFGLGVMFTVVTILVVQGGLALFGSLLIQIIGDPGITESLNNNPLINEMTAVGGLMLIGLSLILMDIKRPRVANFLPALIVAPLLVWLAGLLGVDVYPL